MSSAYNLLLSFQPFHVLKRCSIPRKTIPSKVNNGAGRIIQLGADQIKGTIWLSAERPERFGAVVAALSNIIWRFR